jgi:hypothetical protein
MTSIEFLKWFRQSGVIALTAFNPEGGGEETMSWVATDKTWPKIESWIAERNGRKNIYFTCNETGIVTSKPSKADISDIHFGFTDADPDPGKKYDEARKEILSRANDLINGELPPSCVIDSGHGFNALWRLDEIISNVPEFEAVNKPFSEVMGGKGIFNADRLLRLPGTKNIPSPTKLKKGYPTHPVEASVIYYSDNSYSLEELREYATKQKMNGVESKKSDNTSVPNHRMLLYSDVMERWRGSPRGLNDTTRSGFDFSLGSLLKHRGFSFDEMCAILRAFTYGKGSENTERDFSRIWDRSGKISSDGYNPQSAKQDKQISCVDFYTLMTEDAPEEPDYIEPGFAGPGTFGLIAGPPKAQKSWLMQESLVACATGKSFLCGTFTVPKPLRVFYLQAEMNRKLLRKRARVLRNLTNEDKELLKKNLIVSERFHMLLNDDGVQTAVAIIKEHFPNDPPDIIGMDPLANLFDGENENDNTQIMRFLAARIEAVRQQVNPSAAILMVHHATKKGVDELARDPFVAIRGGGALRGYYDSAIVIYRKSEESGHRKVHFELRSGESPEPMEVELVDGRFQRAGVMTEINKPTARRMLEDTKAAWIACRPLSPHPRADREGRFIGKLARQYDVSASSVFALFQAWADNGVVTFRERVRHKHAAGFEVTGVID